MASHLELCTVAHMSEEEFSLLFPHALPQVLSTTQEGGGGALCTHIAVAPEPAGSSRPCHTSRHVVPALHVYESISPCTGIATAADDDTWTGESDCALHGLSSHCIRVRDTCFYPGSYHTIPYHRYIRCDCVRSARSFVLGIAAAEMHVRDVAMN